MLNFPSFGLPTPKVINALTSPWSALGPYRAAVAGGVPATATGPTAARAIIVPFLVTTPATFRRGWWVNGSAPGGNFCVGIHTPDGVRRATTGNVAASGASTIQQAAFTANYDAPVGLHYMSISISTSAANQVFASAASVAHRVAGLYIMSTANPLPDPITFAAWVSEPLPLFGIAQTSFAI